MNSSEVSTASRLLRKLGEILVGGFESLWVDRKSDEESGKVCEVKSLLFPCGGLQNDNQCQMEERERKP
jgi:hypothetical protein